MAFTSTSAKDPNIAGTQYHIQLKTGDIPPYVLIPGDPDRVEKIASLWDTQTAVAKHREYTTFKGVFKETDIACTSSGIGSPSLAIGLEELVRVGAHTFIRVGSCGSLQPDMQLGDLVITTAAVRLDGTSKEFVMAEYPAVADIAVTNALIASAKSLGVRFHVGITASTDSFYVGQGRPSYGNYFPSHKKDIFTDLQQAKVKNFEMEASCLLTLSSLFGVRSGAVNVVIADRVRDTFEINEEMEKKVGLVASEAVRILYQAETHS